MNENLISASKPFTHENRKNNPPEESSLHAAGPAFHDPLELAAMIRRQGPALWMLDYDNTLAEHSPRPEAAFISPDGRQGLSALCSLPESRVCIVTARNAEQIPGLLRGMEGSRLLISGFYGRQLFDLENQIYLRDEEPRFEEIAGRAWKWLEQRIGEDSRLSGAFLEWKRFSVALHYRYCTAAAGYATAVLAAHECISALGVAQECEIKVSKNLLEVGPKNCDKLDGVQLLRGLCGENLNMIYIGDDVPDESSFAFVNRHGGVSIRVGRGVAPTSAAFRLAAVADVHRLLNAAAVPG